MNPSPAPAVAVVMRGMWPLAAKLLAASTVRGLVIVLKIVPSLGCVAFFFFFFGGAFYVQMSNYHL